MILYDCEIKNLIQILYLRGKNTPDKTAYIYVPEEGDAKYCDFKTLYDNSAKVAGVLKESGIKKGDRCLIMYKQDMELLYGLYGCLMAGAVAVPLDIFDENTDMERYVNVYESCGASGILTNDSAASMMEDSSAKYFGGIPVFHYAMTENAKPYCCEFEDCLAILQYTSGSTGEPKGVMINQSSLLDNLKQIADRFYLTSDSSIVGWLPYHHDMGLIFGLYTAVYTGGRNVFMKPELFKSNPEKWIYAMNDYEATHVVAPNFGYELLCKLLKEKYENGNPDNISLASIERIVSGSESVRFNTQVELMEVCHKFGMKKEAVRAGYGLAEATLMLSMNTSDIPGGWLRVDKKALSENKIVVLERGQFTGNVKVIENDEIGTYLVGNGKPIDDNQLMVLSSDGEQLPKMSIGEICISGPSVAAGYWKRPKETAKTFVKGKDGQVILHTGDAGFIGDDGELYITGRYKESIVIHGVNYYPTDLETVSVKSNKSFNYAACAFSATFEDEDSIIIIQEIKGKTLSLDTLKDAAKDVRNNIFKSYQLQPHKIILVEENSIPRTDSGKIQRRTAKELFIKDALCGVLYEEQMKDADLSQIEVETVEDIKNIIVDLLADSLGIATAEVDLDMTFMKMGMNSQMNVNIVAQLNTVPGVKLSVVDVFNQNTVDKLATHIFDTCFSESIKTDDLDALNEDELAMLLEQELG
ncbi:MAG: AMP-binding protein [Pseudobutyrivibrio sp.]|nr:AMP-binding protein [Pseudobutyrivibrio sp.]